MPIAISNVETDTVLRPQEFSAAEDKTHAECGDELRLLDSGKVQCLTCLKVGFPIPA